MEVIAGFIAIYMLLAGGLEIIQSFTSKIPMLGTFTWPIVKFLQFILFIIMIVLVLLYLIADRLY